MKILVTGANGFIGSTIFSYLKKRGYEVTGCVRHRKRTDEEEFLLCDLAEDIYLDVPADAIVHTAVRSPADGTTFKDYFEDNCLATYHLVRWAERHKVKKFIYLAAVSSYGSVDGVLREDSPHNNPGDYGLSKYVAEKIVRGSAIPNRILALPGVIGKNGHDCWIMRTAERLKCNEKVYCYNPNGLFNNLVAADDLCRFIETLLKEHFQDSQTYIAAAQEKITIRGVLAYLRQELGSDSEVIFGESGENTFYIEPQKIFKAGFESQPIKEILKKACDEVRKTSEKRGSGLP